MRLFISCCLVLVLILAGSPSQALEPLVLYDAFSGRPIHFFKGKPIDPDRWQQAGIAERDILDFVREIRWNSLRLLDRTYGDIITLPPPPPPPPPFPPPFPPPPPPPSLGRKSTAVRVKFPNPEAVTAIMIAGRVKALELEGCGGSTDRVRALRASGFFFNTINDVGPGPDSGAIGDVLASIHLERRGNSLDPPDILRVIASVFLCEDRECNKGTTLISEDLGDYRVRRKIRLLIQWDEENDLFIFQRDRDPQFEYSYFGVVPNMGPPGLPQKRLGVSNRVANCPVGSRPVASVEALINRVYVNESADP